MLYNDVVYVFSCLQIEPFICLPFLDARELSMTRLLKAGVAATDSQPIQRHVRLPDYSFTFFSQSAPCNCYSQIPLSFFLQFPLILFSKLIAPGPRRDLSGDALAGKEHVHHLYWHIENGVHSIEDRKRGSRVPLQGPETIHEGGCQPPQRLRRRSLRLRHVPKKHRSCPQRLCSR